jgi:hypothetical protein
MAALADVKEASSCRPQHGKPRTATSANIAELRLCVIIILDLAFTF